MLITSADLAPFVGSTDSAKLAAMIADAEAFATSVAPCLAERELTPHERDLVKAILRGAIVRRAESGNSGVVTQTAGPYSQTVDTRQSRSSDMFTDGERSQLQAICGGSTAGAAFGVDTASQSSNGPHPPYCSLLLGGSYCSCGQSFVGAPIYYGPDE